SFSYRAHDESSSKRFMEAASLAGRSEPGTLIRGRHHLIMESGNGERREIGRLAEVGFRGAEPANTLIRRGIRTPKGEWRLARRSGISDCSGFGESPTGYRRSRPGTPTSRWGVRRRTLRCGRAKGRFEISVPIGSSEQTGCGALIRI